MAGPDMNIVEAGGVDMDASPNVDQAGRDHAVCNDQRQHIL